MAKYVYPVPLGTKKMQSDQGQDFQGKPGGHVFAIGNARVDYIKPDPGGFGLAIYYTLLDGPAKGQQIYVGHAQPNVTKGEILKAGQPVATLLQNGLGNASHLAGWTEIGLAKGGMPMYSGKSGGPALAALLKGSSLPPTKYTIPKNPHDTAASGTNAGDTTVTPTTTDQTGSLMANQLASDIGNISQVGGPPTVQAPLIGDQVDTSMIPVQSAGNTWQLIAASGQVSQDTLRLASLASLASNASGVGTPQ